MWVSYSVACLSYISLCLMVLKTAERVAGEEKADGTNWWSLSLGKISTFSWRNARRVCRGRANALFSLFFRLFFKRVNSKVSMFSIFRSILSIFTKIGEQFWFNFVKFYTYFSCLKWNKSLKVLLFYYQRYHFCWSSTLAVECAFLVVTNWVYRYAILANKVGISSRAPFIVSTLIIISELIFR